LARKAETTGNTSTQVHKLGEVTDDVNWFGVKVGTGDSTFGSGNGGGAIGKYLSVKRSLEPAADGPVESSKKRKTGFGSFDGW
jgi:peptidyl-prolyl cis-trans isomerase-like 2